MNASESALLQSSLALVKQRFQALVGDSPCKAWLLHVHDSKSAEEPEIYALADGYKTPGVASKQSTWAKLGCPAIGLEVPRFRRAVRLNGSQSLTPICDEAATLLMSLPAAVQSRLWRGMPARTRLATAEGDMVWVLAVFELANLNIAYSSLRAPRPRPRPLTKQNCQAFFDPESKLPVDPDWYSTLPDFAAASAQAIDILQSWLAEELRREAEVASEPPETAETIQRRLQEIVRNCQEEHHLRVRLCMEAFPDLRTGLAKWERGDHKGDCPEWQLANERLVKRFGAIDGEPPRWGLRLRPPIMCVRWDEDAAIDLGRAIRDDLFDAARSAIPEATNEPPKPVEPQGGALAGGRRAEAAFEFRPNGDGYYIKGFGQSGHVTAKGAKGLHDLFRLVQTPGVLVPMLELHAGPGVERAEGDGQSHQPVADGETLKQLAAKRKQLKADIESAGSDMERNELETELAAVEAAAKGMRGLDGKPRDMNNPLDKLRPKLLKRISTAVRQLREANLDRLADDFDSAVTSEAGCLVYRPAVEGLTWNVTNL